MLRWFVDCISVWLHVKRSLGGRTLVCCMSSHVRVAAREKESVCGRTCMSVRDTQTRVCQYACVCVPHRYAQTGEPVNILICTSAMALDAVGFACFGIDLHASPVTDLGDSVFSTKGR